MRRHLYRSVLLNRERKVETMLYGITSEELAHHYKETEVLRIYKEIGFDAIDYSYDMHAYPGSIYDQKNYAAYAKELRKVADVLGIRIHQMHAPLYHRRIDVEATKEEQLEEAFLKKMTIRGFEVAEILGCRYMVMHPRKLMHYGSQEAHDFAKAYNLQMYQEYADLARKHHVKIALENMFAYDPITHTPIDTVLRTAEEMVAYLKELPADVFVACLDSGHANVNGIDPAYMAEALGPYLKVLHVHDNYAALDQHLLCGLGTVDWNAFAKALKKIQFTGVVSLETCSMCEKLPKISCEDYARLAYHTITNIVK